MIISVGISYYPLSEAYAKVVDDFIGEVAKRNVTVESGKMSSVITGEYREVMHVLTETIGEFMQKYPSVFTIKISNYCPV